MSEDDTPFNANEMEQASQLLEAIEANDLDSVKSLLEKGAPVNFLWNDDITPLVRVVQKGFTADLEILKALIAADAYLNEPDIHGNTALMIAVQTGHLDMVRTLIEAKSNLTLTNKRGFSALKMAQIQQKADIEQLLQEAIAQIIQNHQAD
jgi:ankyrin repeat protein